MGKTTPQTFDVDAWLDGLKRPQRSVRIYQRGDLMARLDDLAARIEAAEDMPSVEHSMADESPMTLRLQYAEVAEQMEAASILVTVQGHDADEREVLLKDMKDARPKARARVLMFDALVSPVMSREQFDRFVDGIGPAQGDKIAGAYQAACSDLPEPSADFLPQPSTLDEDR